METKICKVCNIEKPLSGFYLRKDSIDGYRNDCSECHKTNKKKYREKFPEKEKNTTSKWRKNNPDTIKKLSKQYYDNNKERIIDNNKNYYLTNKEKIIKKVIIREKLKMKSDPIFKLHKNVRNRVKKYLMLENFVKQNKTFEIIGCSPKFLKEYIEKKFTEGMSWELMGKHIHIDHIIPLSSAKTEEEVYKLCHYTNLQPLWAEDNLKKGSKIKNIF